MISNSKANLQSSLFSLSSVLSDYKPKEKNKYISKEFQDFGYRLAVELDDLEHKSLYMRLAKTHNRGLLEEALSFVSDSSAKSKPKLFMWKLKQIRDKLNQEEKKKSSK